LQEILVAACWILWLASLGPNETWRDVRVVAIPLGLAILVLLWAVVQIMPGVPASWAHPIWAMTSDALGRPLPGVISLNPWRTETEIVKLGSYIMACWLAFRLARRSETANTLLTGIIAIGALYAVYAIVLAFAHYGQVNVFYSVPYTPPAVSGPFMSRNNFAAFSGLAVIAATAKLFSMGGETIVTTRGARQLLLTIFQFVFGRGAPVLIVILLCLGAVVASGSRAGFASTMCGLAALALASLVMFRRSSSRLWAGAGALTVMLPLFMLVILNGDTLASRLNELFDTGTVDAVRLTLWAAASRMIADAPWLGLGLGTFQDAYPLYATQVLPYVLDKAHCDYLEFAAGIGLPAAIAWWAAMLGLVVVCIRGVRIRRRNRLYALAAIGASVLIAVHSIVDFSLQLPAISLLYATLLGIGVSQSFSTR
jgi:O-antigen ligase